MRQAGQNYVRSVGGDLVSSIITDTTSVRIEMNRRSTAGRMHWHFRQPELSLWCFTKGAQRLKASVDGKSVDRSFSGKSRLAIVPSAVEIDGEWNVGPTLDYIAIFLNPAFVEGHLENAITHSTIAFDHDGLSRGLAELCREAVAPDNFFNLMAEGWSIQALAHISRISEKRDAHTDVKGGLSGRHFKRVEHFVRENLNDTISLGNLSKITGLSKRHFLRAFQASAGMTPYKYVLTVRITEAKRRLTETDESITDVALAAGFPTIQHFSNSFRAATGETPSSYRQRAQL